MNVVPLPRYRMRPSFLLPDGMIVGEATLLHALCEARLVDLEGDDAWSAALGDAHCCVWGGVNIPWPYPP